MEILVGAAGKGGARQAVVMFVIHLPLPPLSGPTASFQLALWPLSLSLSLWGSRPAKASGRAAQWKMNGQL